MPKQRKRGIKGAGSVYRRQSDGRYVGSFMVEETGKRKYIYADTEKDAWEKLQQAQQEQKQGILATGPKQKLETFLNKWFEESFKHNIRTGTYVRYRGLLKNHILPALGHLQLQKLTAQKIQSFLSAKLQEGQSKSSVTHMQSILKQALEKAVQWRLISFNPCYGTSVPNSIPTRKGQSLTVEQARHLLEVLQGHPLEAFILLALNTGMRHGELLALRWEDINLEAATLQVQRTVYRWGRFGFQEGEPKTESSKRKILLSPAMGVVLKAHRQRQEGIRIKAGAKWQEHGLVFCNKYGSFQRDGTVAKRFHALLEKAGLPKIRIHDLRHSAATLMAEFKVNPKVIQEMLGHSTMDMTMSVYSHVLPSMQKEAVEKMKNLFQPPPEE